MLEAVFGDAAVRSLAARAREDLEARADALLRCEQDRFDARLDAAAPAPGARRGAADAVGRGSAAARRAPS